MNERIEELKTQCIVREQRGTNAFDSYMVDRFDTKKFAELIVRECANYITEYYPHSRYEAFYMKKHFGVEE